MLWPNCRRHALERLILVNSFSLPAGSRPIEKPISPWARAEEGFVSAGQWNLYGIEKITLNVSLRQGRVSAAAGGWVEFRRG